MTAGPMPPRPSGDVFGGMSLLVRNCQLMAEIPLATTVTITKPSGTTVTTKAIHISTVAIWFLERRQPPASRRSTAGWTGACDSHQAPLIRRAERSTMPRAARLTMIVRTNSTRPMPISAARQVPNASGNWLAMTAGIE